MARSYVKQKAIVECMDKLSMLTGENFHGYRSEVWSAISGAIDECLRGEEATISDPVPSCGTCPGCSGVLSPVVFNGSLVAVNCIACNKHWK